MTQSQEELGRLTSFSDARKHVCPSHFMHVLLIGESNLQNRTCEKLRFKNRMIQKVEYADWAIFVP